MPSHEDLMLAAIEIARTGVAANQSPFGAAIATADGRIVCATHNTVRATTDPTAHAEVNAIRKACQTLDTIDLSGCTMATTCEPCPMCAAAIHWARIDTVIYGATIDDADHAGFNELHVPCETIYKTGHSHVRVIRGLLQTRCAELFNLWKNGPNPNPY